jgi:hypothetical protein
MRPLAAVLFVGLAASGCRDRELAQLERARDQVCACKDAACIKAALKLVPSREVTSTPRSQAVARTMLECIAAIYQPEAGEPKEPTEAPAAAPENTPTAPGR